MRSHIRQSIVEASAAGWCDTGLSAPSLGSSDNNNLPVSGVRISGITPATPFFLLMFSQRAETLEPSLFIKYFVSLMSRCFPSSPKVRINITTKWIPQTFCGKPLFIFRLVLDVFVIRYCRKLIVRVVFYSVGKVTCSIKNEIIKTVSSKNFTNFQEIIAFLSKFWIWLLLRISVACLQKSDI